MYRARAKLAGLVLLCGTLLYGTAVVAAPKSASPPVDPKEQLDQFLIREKIEFENQAHSFFDKLVDAGCKPEDALRWTRMALFVDPVWNLSELTGMVEEQMQTDATHQVIQDEVEKRIHLRAAELKVDLGDLPATLATPGAKPGPAKPKTKPNKVQGK
ncbi:MAG: hypothetical protein RBU45_17785 [Myxococcota bacterium]|jgi:hypothetical protein|nr:hypothetical protein [Myxococcota bacterium]